MQDQGSGGFGFVSVGISEALIAFLVLIVVLYMLWKGASSCGRPSPTDPPPSRDLHGRRCTPALL